MVKTFSPVRGTTTVVQIPKNWSAFFTTLLLSPTHFDWARKLVNSEALKFIHNSSKSQHYFSFALPEVCPMEQSTCYSILDKTHIASIMPIEEGADTGNTTQEQDTRAQQST